VEWSETWRAPEERLSDLAARLTEAGAWVVHGGGFDRWDLEVRWGSFGSARVLMVIEEYARGRQLVRWRAWPRFSPVATAAGIACAGLTVWAASAGAVTAALAFGAVGITLLARAVRDAAAATGGILQPLQATRAAPESPVSLPAPASAETADVA
jgi:hypothetical protein